MGGSHAKKIGDVQKKKFFINNSFETLILFNEEHCGLLKLLVPLWWEKEWRIESGSTDRDISKIGGCETGSSLWTVMVGWQFLVVSLWRSAGDGVTGKAGSGCWVAWART